MKVISGATNNGLYICVKCIRMDCMDGRELHQGPLL